MASKTRRFFISDVHLSDAGVQRAWFQDRHRPNLLAFLGWVADQGDAKDLVLLGDLFDAWMFPMDVAPVDVRAIGKQAQHREVVEAIKACARVLDNVFYVNGNHDMHVTQADLDDVFGAGVVKWIPRYSGGLLYAEHGSRFAMFNAPDNLHDPGGGYPLGYFITRLLVSSTVEYGSPAAFAGYVDDLLEAAFTTQTIAESHGAELDKDMELPFVRAGRIYANAGCWCRDEPGGGAKPAKPTPAKPTFVEVDKQRGSFVVRWWECADGGVRAVASEEVKV